MSQQKQRDMPRHQLGNEECTDWIAIRIPKDVKDVVYFAAKKDNINVSNWVRRLIISELKARNLLQ